MKAVQHRERFPVGDTWICHLSDFLDDRGSIGPRSGPARRLAEQFGAIVAAASDG